MTENFDAALGFPAGPLADPAPYWRAPRFPLLHADPECQALRDWRTGCWPGTDDRPRETPQEVIRPIAAVLTGGEPACPCAHRLPAALHTYRLDGQLLADLRAHRGRLAEPTVDAVVDALLLLDEADRLLAGDRDPGDLRGPLAAAAAELAATAEQARVRLAADPAHRAELLTAAVVAGKLSGAELGSLHTAATRALEKPAAGDQPLGAALSMAAEALNAVRGAWMAAYVRTGDFTEATEAALSHPDAPRTLVDRWSSGNERPAPAESRAHVRLACSVWQSAMRATEAVPPAAPAQLVAFPDWRAVLTDRAPRGESLRAATRQLFALSPVHRVGDVAFVAADPLELASFEEQAEQRTPRRTTFGAVPDGDWRQAAALAWQLWTDADGPQAVSDLFANDLTARRRRAGTLQDPYAALAAAIGILADRSAAAG